MRNVSMPFIIKWPGFKSSGNELEKTKVFKLKPLAADAKAAPHAALKAMSGPDAGKSFEIGANGGFIGRKTDCKVFLRDSNISRFHAFLGWEKGRLFIEDKGSTNGTFVNGKKIKKRFLLKGDRIKIGDSEIVVGVIG
ncbi:MAG: FHA domain-containing protein [Bacillota bacterium]